MTFIPTTFTALAENWTVTAGAGPVPAGFPVGAVPATVPGVIHTDLLRAGLIDPPFDGDAEAAQQWIGSTEWHYECSFSWVDDGHTRHDLVAFGLDTVATIELNGHLLGHTQNQHRSYRFDIRQALREGENHLTVTFAAPVVEVESRDGNHGAWPHVNHHPYNQLRKSAANFGWDWGIDVATSGIWQPIGIDSWSNARIAAVRPLIDLDGTTGVLTAHVTIERDDAASSDDTPVDIDLHVTVGDKHVTALVPPRASEMCVVVRVPDAQLWWPIGHGEQPLYNIAAVLSAQNSDGIARWHGRVGFRTVALDTSADEGGNRFVVRVNGETILIRGVNWIPDHAFVTEIDRARYEARFADAVDANVNLLRVWGGGIYESDDFYELADERGLLVWQDFLFACAGYSEESWLADEVEAEAREQIARLSAHPSLVIWNGNNENIWGYVEWGWREALGNRAWGDGYYRTLLPRLLAELDPTRAYSPASPYSFVDYAHPNDPRNGTTHIWDVWNERDYTAYREHAPRFVSEFGFQGPPAWSTLTSVVHDEPLDPYGAQMLVHQKAEYGNLKLERGMAGHLPTTCRIEDWHWATQLNQAHAIRYGVEYFRSLTPHNTGTILWQLNDNWPSISWAAVDFDGHRKPMWYALRDAYRPRLATIQPTAAGLALVLVNDTAATAVGRASVSRVTFSGVEAFAELIDIVVGARTAVTVPLSERLTAALDPACELIVATIDGFERALWNPGEVVDQAFEESALAATAVRTDTGYAVTVTATSYLRDVCVHADRVDPAAVVDCGMVSLLAGESVVFAVTSSAVLDPIMFTDRLVLRHAGDLIEVT
ncbi:glycoside hydrolase family 2 protein [Rathayibacter soli]|uniref:glycoside hydrolase family 2 protein n=1 Tax=Rathayibacter soli TaxID=3144168 RepID=UPI0027E41EF7|nr:glycoside hydrolase family 2 protein [Glaciibacter superstes]